MNRRKFIETSVKSGAAMSVIPMLECSQGFPRRQLGRTGVSLPIIGFGGILVMNVEQKAANDLVAAAFNAGLNYFDVAPTYGNAQDRLGPALAVYRKDCFLACKTTERKKAAAQKELDESLRTLQTDYLDLYQLHALSTLADVETAFAADGAMEVLVNAREQGKVRFLGFSAHSEQAALAALEKFDFDTVLFPVNFVCWLEGDFGPRLVEKAKSRGMGILALKSMALRRLNPGEKSAYDKCWYRPNEDDALAELGLRFTLSQGTTAAIPPGESVFFHKAVRIAGQYKPLSEAELEKLRAAAKGLTPLFSNKT